MKRTKISFALLKVVVSLGLLGYLLCFQIDLAQFWAVVRRARWGYLLAATLLMIAGTALRAVRWQVLLRALEIEVPLRRLVYLYFVGSFFNIFLPSGLGGDAVKMAELAQSTDRTPEAIGTTLVDRATGLWVLFLLALLALPFSADLLPAGWLPLIAVSAVGGVLGGWLVLASPLVPWLGARVRLPGQEQLERFYRSISQLGYPALGRACLVSLVFDLLLIAFNVLVALSFDLQLPLTLFLLFTPLISFSLALPISIGGLGVREQTYILLFGAVGVSEVTAMALSLANYAVTNLVVGALGGIVYVIFNTKELTVDD
ncbi:MAG: lysylphosphatidylglycerol synthase transmembrane domain-containing protein [Chloroflexota bacterium]|nr:lysylphosphatidylglycerol synthase transmembrane domain-containing protein [Chloroflexota bacterium]